MKDEDIVEQERLAAEEEERREAEVAAERARAEKERKIREEQERLLRAEKDQAERERAERDAARGLRGGRGRILPRGSGESLHIANLGFISTLTPFP